MQKFTSNTGGDFAGKCSCYKLSILLCEAKLHAAGLNPQFKIPAPIPLAAFTRSGLLEADHPAFWL